MKWHFVLDPADGRIVRVAVATSPAGASSTGPVASATWLGWPGATAAVLPAAALDRPRDAPPAGTAPAGLPDAAPAAPGPVGAPCAGRLLRYAVPLDAAVAAGEPVAFVEAMKMEFAVLAPRAGRVARHLVAVGAVVAQGAAVVALAEGGCAVPAGEVRGAGDADPATAPRPVGPRSVTDQDAAL